MDSVLKRFFRFRVIAPDCPDGRSGPPLLTRYFLLRYRSWALFLHHFHRSDIGEFHDHPWAFVTFLLSSGYWEHEPVGQNLLDLRSWRRRFSILYRRATHRHYVEIPKPMWTLVLRFREEREWGFWIEGKWFPWRTVENLKSRSICED